MKRSTRESSPIRKLCPGDWLKHASGASIGFVWSVDGDRVEVRNYEKRIAGEAFNPTIRHLTRAQASSYIIVPNPAYGDERPMLEVGT